MRTLDYLRLGAAGMKAHKKRALVIVVIVGLLFEVVAAGAFFLQGLEKVALAEMLTPTEGKVLVMSSVDTRACGEDCEVAAEVEKIKEKIGEHGGEVVPVAVQQTAEGMFYVVDEGVFREVFSGVKVDSAESEGGETMTVVVPLEVAAAVLSLVNMAALKEVFAMGFGVVMGEIWLVGWSGVIWWLAGALLIAAVLAVVLGNGNFAGKELGKRMK